jgi:hypothetical protein
MQLNPVRRGADHPCSLSKKPIVRQRDRGVERQTGRHLWRARFRSEAEMERRPAHFGSMLSAIMRCPESSTQAKMVIAIARRARSKPSHAEPPYRGFHWLAGAKAAGSLPKTLVAGLIRVR